MLTGTPVAVRVPGTGHPRAGAPAWRRLARGALALLAVSGMLACGGGNDAPTAPAPAPPAATPTPAPAPTPTPAPSGLAAPTGLVVSAVTADSVTWSWNAVEGASSYELQGSLDEVFDDTDEIRTTEEPTLTVTGFQPGMSAYVRVRSVGGTEAAPLRSAWTSPVIGTSAPGPAPTPEPTPPRVFMLNMSGVPPNVFVPALGTLTITAHLEHHVQPTVEVRNDAEVSARVTATSPRPGEIEITVVGLRADWAANIRLRAFHPGFDDGHASFSILVTPPIPPSWFDWELWNALVFDNYECPPPDGCGGFHHSGPLEGRRVQVRQTKNETNFHIRTQSARGERPFTDEEVAVVRQAILDAVEALTGHPLAGRLTVGPEDVQEFTTVTVYPFSAAEWAADRGAAGACGRAVVNGSPGYVKVNLAITTVAGGTNLCSLRAVVMHEVGHAMGFWHIPPDRRGMMTQSWPVDSFLDAERDHARIAYVLNEAKLYPGVQPGGSSSSASSTGGSLPRPPARELQCSPGRQ